MRDRQSGGVNVTTSEPIDADRRINQILIYRFLVANRIRYLQDWKYRQTRAAIGPSSCLGDGPTDVSVSPPSDKRTQRHMTLDTIGDSLGKQRPKTVGWE
jgi:hypothetical protein